MQLVCIDHWSKIKYKGDFYVGYKNEEANYLKAVV